jgi:hypothetical protein
MSQRPELSPVVVQFINDWVKSINNNPTTTLGEWLYAFGACSGLALQSQQLTAEQVEDAVGYMNNALTLIYKNSNTPFKTHSMQ